MFNCNRLTKRRTMWINAADNCQPLLIQQHIDSADVFNRSWAEYKVGFSDPRGNYWIGNDRLSQLTMTNRYKLMIDIQSRNNRKWYYVEYSTFIVQPESDNYRLNVWGYSGNASDEFSWQNGMMFSTFDRDNDQHRYPNCAANRASGFWYKTCCGFCANSPNYHIWYRLHGEDARSFLQSSRMWLQLRSCK